MTIFLLLTMKKFIYCLLILFFACTSDTQEKSDNSNTDSTKNNTNQIKLSDDFDLQGHRGTRGLLPENTIPAFLKAVELGVTTVELDVVVSKDGQMVVSHEPFFNHAICLNAEGEAITEENEKEYNIYQYTVQEIKAFDCGTLGNPNFPEQEGQKVSKPTLQEAIQAVENYIQTEGKNSVFYNIETKSTPEGDNVFHPIPQKFSQLLYDELKELNVLDKVFIQSFDVRTLQAFREIDKDVPLVLLVEEENPNSFEENLEVLGFNPIVYSPNFNLVNEELIEKSKTKNIKVIPWTVNEVSDMQKMIGLGVDGLITDYPNRFQESFR